MTKFRFKVGDIFLFNDGEYIMGIIERIDDSYALDIRFNYKIIKEDRIPRDIRSSFAYESRVYEIAKIISKEEAMIERL